VHYRVAITNPADNHSVSVCLLYQPIQSAFIDGLLATGGRPDPLFPAVLLAATAWLGMRRCRQPWPGRRRK